MANVLLIDLASMFLNTALRCSAAGHKVKWFCGNMKDGSRSKVGDGFGLRVTDWKAHMDWADIVLLADNAKWMKEMTAYQKKGYPIIGGNLRSADLELNRRLGQESFERAGLDVMPSEAFSDHKKAEEYVRKEMKRMVSKPDGDVDKALSYCAKSPADMICKLRMWNSTPGNKGRQFILQEFCPGVEVAIGGFFGKHGFGKYVCENFEHKKFMNDNLGRNTGEQGTVIKWVEKGDSKLYKDVLRKVEDELHKVDYTGYVDIAVIVDEDGSPRPLEYTTRFGWPLQNIILSTLHDPVEYLMGLLDGEDLMRPDTDVCTGVVMTIPDFPYTELTSKEVSGYPIYHLDADNPYRFYLAPAELQWGNAPCMCEDDTEIEDKDLFVSAGDYLVIASGLGETVTTSCREAYKAVESIEIPNDVQYRTDIGKRLKDDLEVLQGYGFCEDWEYS